MKELDFIEKDYGVIEPPKHWSDCAVYNGPAYKPGPCDCGGFKDGDADSSGTPA